MKTVEPYLLHCGPARCEIRPLQPPQKPVPSSGEAGGQPVRSGPPALGYENSAAGSRCHRCSPRRRLPGRAPAAALPPPMPAPTERLPPTRSPPPSHASNLLPLAGHRRGGHHRRRRQCRREARREGGDPPHGRTGGPCSPAAAQQQRRRHCHHATAREDGLGSAPACGWCLARTSRTGRQSYSACKVSSLMRFRRDQLCAYDAAQATLEIFVDICPAPPIPIYFQYKSLPAGVEIDR